jgi:type VI secretion system protein ImpH
MREPVLSPGERLIEHPYEFDFFQAVRLLSLLLPDRPGVGDTAKPSEEAVRFQARQSLEFPASSIHSLEAAEDPARMVVAFFGLTGVQGVLPHHYTEHIIARAAARDFSMAAFFDLFNHRLVSLFYRAWEKHRFPVLYQLATARSQGTDRFTGYLFDLVGMGTGGLRGRMEAPDQALLRYAGLLAQTPRSACGLRGLLRDYFEVEVEVREFQGGWYALAEDERCDLAGPGVRNQLGVGAVAGDAVWDPQARFSIELGPLGLSGFLSFLPGERAARELVELTRFFTGEVLQFDWQPLLRAAEVPWCCLGDEGPAGPRLGWCAWLKTEEFERDAADAVFAAG